MKDRIMEKLENVSAISYLLLVFGALVLVGFTLYLMGQPVICECGFLKIWDGNTGGAESSKHLFDWYTPSHIIHGFLFFWLVDWLFPKLPLGAKLLAALAPEIAWELIENTDVVIEYYRSNTVSVEYVGDSVINSLGDIVGMMFGFFVAFWLPWWLVLVLFLGMEITAIVVIRDNLFLNVLMLLYPIEAVAEWQAAG